MSAVPLTVAQAAQHARVATKTIRRWLASGRLEASRGLDGAWLIDVDALDRAVATPGQGTDSPGLALGHGQVQSLVHSMLDRLEAQAQRIGQLDAELVSTRAELAEARQRLLALEAPKPEPADFSPTVGEKEFPAEPTENSRPAWWQVWRRVTAS